MHCKTCISVLIGITFDVRHTPRIVPSSNVLKSVPYNSKMGSPSCTILDPVIIQEPWRKLVAVAGKMVFSGSQAVTPISILPLHILI